MTPQTGEHVTRYWLTDEGRLITRSGPPAAIGAPGGTIQELDQDEGEAVLQDLRDERAVRRAILADEGARLAAVEYDYLIGQGFPVGLAARLTGYTPR